MATAPDESLIQKLSPPAAAVDLQGGTLLDVKEFDEVDETDGCKVHVTEYHILSADGQEEMTKTCRRKLKIECNQSTRKTEIANGREALIEEKTERLFGDIDGFRQPIVLVDRSKALMDFSNSEDSAISAVLQKTQENFLSLLNEQKDQLINMFPELFSEMRTSSSLSDAPQTEVETIVNPDGSTTTRTRSSRAYSTRFSKHEMYVNGVKQESKSKFRAFMEYKGPDGGFKVKLRDTSGDDDLSEEEADDVNEDVIADTESQISEIPDTQSVMISGVGLNRVPAMKEKIMKRTEKAWLAAKELVDSEQRYVEKLRLLDETFRKKIDEEKILEKDRITQLFANISSLHQFHNTHLLPALMESAREWHTTHRISDVLRKRAPFLKMYSEYTNNYKRATKVFNDCLRKKRRFAQIVHEIEMKPECENLPLVSHLICPVQRVMRYQLLLQEYKKHLDPSDVDYDDTVAALELVLDAASHANEMMRKLDRYRNVLEVQEQIGSAMSLVSPGRELIRKGKVMKILSSSEKTEERHLFLFNDLLILASERTLPGFAKLKVRAIFDTTLAQIFEGDNLERENSFYVRGSDSPTGPSRCVELMTETSEEKSVWIDAVWNVISESLSRKRSFSPPVSFIASINLDTISTTVTSPRSENRCCAKCNAEFSFISRGTTCAHCAQRFCKKCFGKLRSEDKTMRICDTCLLQRDYSQPKENHLKTRTNPLLIGAQEGEILHASYVKLRGSMNKPLKRYFVVRKDFCVYSYASDTAEGALAMLPLPGCQVKMSNERLTFTVKHMHRQYLVSVDCEATQIKWMAVLDLVANAVLREKANS
uniref:DH domain-containing protein n=1 Tax=Elaeophora elaphi TaxID=1147741 RepID=A0A158Q6U5_9BILA